MTLLDSYYKVPEAATILGVHPETIKRLCQRGRIRAEKVHNTWLIQKEKLEEFALTYNNPKRSNREKAQTTKSQRLASRLREHLA